MIKANLIRGLILSGALMLVATVSAADGRCYTAEIPGTMVLPDGSRFEPDVLRICTDRDISPVSKLHRTDVGGRQVGMFLSVPHAIEASVPEGAAQFVFKRNGSGDLNLVGYVVTSCNETTFFEIVSPGKGKARDTAYIANLGATENDETIVLIAGG